MEKVVEIRIDDLLEQRGKSAYWLAHQVGITEAGLHKVRHGKVKAITIDLLNRLCDALECEPGDVLVRVVAKKKSAARK